MISPGDQQAILDAIMGKRPSAKGWVRANCPMCLVRIGKVDRHTSLGVNLRTGIAHCFRCGAKGALHGDHYERDEQPSGVRQTTVVELEPPESYVPLFEGDARNSIYLAGARDYVRGRGLSETTAREAKIGACTSGRFAGRIIMPTFDAAGRWRWYVGRSWVPKCERPYLYPVGDRTGVLYNERALSVRTDEPLLVVEGAFDALAHWPDAVAVLGKPTDIQLARIAKAPRPVCMVLDGDAVDESLSCAMLLRLLDHPKVGVVELGPRLDPDEIPTLELRRLAREACAAA